MEAYARPPTGYETQGQPGQAQVSSDGAKPGWVVYRFGTAVSVVRDMPGWYIADGTQPAVVIEGTSYQPNLVGKFIIGADGSTFPIGGTGGSAAHTHPFTPPSAHVITQPAFSLTAHDITQPVFAAPNAHGTHTAHSNHGGTAAEFTATPGSGVWINTYNSSANAAAGLVHDNNHTAHTNNHSPDPLTRSIDVGLNHNHDNPTRITDVALSNNHSGGSVDAATGDNKYPPYVAVWPLIKVY